MLGFGPTEMVLILVLVLIVFGAGKLPQVFGSLGKGIKEFREASEGTSEQPAPALHNENGAAAPIPATTRTTHTS